MKVFITTNVSLIVGHNYSLSWKSMSDILYAIDQAERRRKAEEYIYHVEADDKSLIKRFSAAIHDITYLDIKVLNQIYPKVNVPDSVSNIPMAYTLSCVCPSCSSLSSSSSSGCEAPGSGVVITLPKDGDYTFTISKKGA